MEAKDETRQPCGCPYFNSLLGVHYMRANRSTEAVGEFDRLVQSASADKIDPSLWYDYAEASYMAAMPSHTIWALSNAYGTKGTALLRRDQLYEFVQAKRRLPGEKEKILSDTLYHVERLESYVALVSRPFGIRVPMKTDWQAQLGDCENASTSIALKPIELKNNRGTAITYRIGIQCFANNAENFDDFVATAKASLKNTTKISNISKALPFVAYEWSDPQMYSSVGGGHGYILFLERQDPFIKGLGLERIPGEVKPTQENKLQYFSLTSFYDRFQGPIYYKIILDTCNDIFKESRMEFQWFLDNLIVE